MLTLGDVLSIRHPERPAWSPDGSRLAFPYLVDGRRELWTVGADAPPTRASGDGQIVGAFDWGAGGRLTYAVGDAVWVAGEGEPLLDGLEPLADLRYAPGGTVLALLRKGRLTLLGPAGRVREVAVPGQAQAPLLWSPGGTRLVCAILDGGQRDLAVIDAATGDLLWRTRTPDAESGAGWVGEDRLSFARTSLDSTRREWVIADLGSGAEQVVERQESAKGFGVNVPPVVSPDGAAIAYTWPVDGWPHVVVYDIRTGTRTVVLPGEHEDLGTETERPCFSPDGRSLAFASSHGDLRQRHIWRYDLGAAGAAPRRLTAAPGTHCDPVWSPDGGWIACVACGPRQSPEVALVVADGAAERPLTRSMPDAWAREPVVEPEHLLLRSADGMQVHADLFVPAGLDRSRRHAALVFVHGGPSRQMRYGWHPMHSYAVFYAFNQLMLHEGYVVISVDYRGGTGYGLAYEQANYLQFAQGDVDDCVAAAAHLKSLPFVDPDRVGIWGLSYGGYMTLAALTKRPDVFAMGINIAGIWDFEQWARWIRERNPGQPMGFERRWGGPKGEANADAYREMSPRNFADGLRAPLLNLHGTADANVDFAQLDEIVRDCTARGKDFAALYYPDETHMFTKRATWEDAFRRMVAAFDRYLRCEPDKRPPAMI